jgi:hypothetical protein
VPSTAAALSRSGKSEVSMMPFYLRVKVGLPKLICAPVGGPFAEAVVGKEVFSST